LTSIQDSNIDQILVPDNIENYFYDYGHSKFIECNSELVSENYKRSNGEYRQNETKNELLMPCFLNITRELENMHKNYWLSSGSILGLKNNLYINGCFF
jgi:hypothetical protein